MFARLIFAIVNFNARKGLNERPVAAPAGENPDKQRALRTGIRGETYAYWYLRRHGYILVARNFTSPGLKGEIDMVGYDGQTLAFVEVKTRSRGTAPSTPESLQATPESAVNIEKRRNISRVATQFLRARHLDENAECRFDVLAIETRAGQKPVVRLHKGAFNAGEYRPRQY
ncbi:MAG TPA: YraN family protein [Candidatus Acidoferrales bacterium]